MPVSRRALLSGVGASLGAVPSAAGVAPPTRAHGSSGPPGPQRLGPPPKLAADEVVLGRDRPGVRHRPDAGQPEQRRVQPGACPRARGDDPGPALLQRDPGPSHVERPGAADRVGPPRARRRVRLRSGGDGDHAQRLGGPRDPDLRHRPRARRRGRPDQPELSPDDHELGAARAPRRDRPEADLLSRSRPPPRPTSSSASGGRSRRGPGSSK